MLNNNLNINNISKIQNIEENKNLGGINENKMNDNIHKVNSIENIDKNTNLETTFGGNKDKSDETKELSKDFNKR
jgi:predicted transcriptional regulator